MKLAKGFDGNGAIGGEWLRGTGADSDIVISSRIRLARNLRGHRFGIQADPEERAAIEDEVRAGLGRTAFPEEMLYIPLADAPPLDAEVLVERHLISKELARAEGPRGVCYAPGENVSIMVQEEDHLRIQVLRSGLQLDTAWEAADAADTRISRHLDYAYSARYGYLTCCPTNVGTGMRASVMLHLPALVYTKHVEKVFQAGAKMSLAVRGLYGEGTQPSSDFFQISNQVCLGVTETDVIDRLQRVVPQFIQYERKVREALLQSDRAALEDKCWRAYAALRAARTITSEETLEMLSAVRLGVNLGLLPTRLTIEIVNELFIVSQPAHLQRLSTGPIDPKARDVARATLLRTKLGAID
ncbi:MAG: protein arginine kinase [Planctomycetes bacterium]|nr:protein arginine kinase [Planctomycetota bacterium]